MTALTHASPTSTRGASGAGVHGQQHPIGLYLLVWGLLFILSACSYLVDYFDFHGELRWGLIILFMLLKAGLIVAVFMHMAWERLALVAAILVPPLAVLVFVATMALEGDYTRFTRSAFFAPTAVESHAVEH
ncbi:cytochrome C oxidase subunit IV family protein [Methylocystis sp. MJC1]|uniref:cytochrome C oxidase subunit IV family protein n=1 Tax=Methylocystis sp. MJC1 TaxID=2654282 RepID=UPI0013E99EF0|nr:cytochrome C oxidase subunit IV family protein [Methylocystis sp. MJC1]MBU6526470.1 cytochrome C oxidase subunit IV family protein [Methylocystis sp. MJC1]UZX13684.1 cytochrome C oxidase subunit IV family protein [Methylocystis sp. MJC1]